jgi:hypothetical protein
MTPAAMQPEYSDRIETLATIAGDLQQTADIARVQRYPEWEDRTLAAAKNLLNLIDDYEPRFGFLMTRPATLPADDPGQDQIVLRGTTVPLFLAQARKAIELRKAQPWRVPYSYEITFFEEMQERYQAYEKGMTNG